MRAILTIAIPLLTACETGLDRYALPQAEAPAEEPEGQASSITHGHDEVEEEASEFWFSELAPPPEVAVRVTPYHMKHPSPPPANVIDAWDLNQLTWCLAGQSMDLPRSIQAIAINRAAASWSELDGIMITPAATCEKANIVINFYEPGAADADFAEDTEDYLLATTNVPGNTQQIEIHVNDAADWVAHTAIDAAETVDIQTAILHELGHALGLDHSDVEFAVMYPYYTGSNRKLSWEDVHGIRNMHGTDAGPCADSAAVAMQAYEAAVESVWSAESLNAEYEQLAVTSQAMEQLREARNVMWDGYNAAYASDVIDARYAGHALAIFEHTIFLFQEGRISANTAYVATASEHALDAAGWATDVIELVRQAERHATECHASAAQ